MNKGLFTMKNNYIQTNNTSGHTGVQWHSRNKVWTARIKINGIAVHLGTFSNKNDAIAARVSADKVVGASQ